MDTTYCSAFNELLRYDCPNFFYFTPLIHLSHPSETHFYENDAVLCVFDNSCAKWPLVYMVYYALANLMLQVLVSLASHRFPIAHQSIIPGLIGSN